MTFDDELDALTHDHVFLGGGHDENARRTLWVVGLTAVMMIGEIIAGTIFSSMALLADGFHVATHAGALAVAAAAYAIAKNMPSLGATPSAPARWATWRASARRWFSAWWQSASPGKRADQDPGRACAAGTLATMPPSLPGWPDGIRS